MFMAPVSASPNIIDGVTVYNPLPAAGFTDLDKECIIPIGGEIDSFDVDDLAKDLDQVIDSGVLPNGVHWGITDRNADGFADVLIDSVEVTVEIIKQLIAAKVVTVC